MNNRKTAKARSGLLCLSPGSGKCASPDLTMVENRGLFLPMAIAISVFVVLGPVRGECLEINGVTITDEQPFTDDNITIANSSDVTIEASGTSRMVAERIVINQGFHAKQGSVFEARAAENPGQNTILGVHGSPRSITGSTHPTYVDYPEMFVYGRFLPGGRADNDPSNNPPANFCPWLNAGKDHIHIDPTNPTGDQDWMNSEDFFTTVDDLNATSGIDRAMVMFYGGHGVGSVDGSTTGFDAQWGDVHVDDVFVGDGNLDSGIGGLRYLLFHSCRLFSHGPLVDCDPGPGVAFDYCEPHNFVSGTNESSAHRNVYQRWDQALSGNVRMACGQSDVSGFGPSNSNKFWDDFLNNGDSILDAWLTHKTTDINLCITRGGDDYNLTPLHTDYSFTNHANPGGPNLFIAFYVSGTKYTDQKNAFLMQPSSLNYLPVFRWDDGSSAALPEDSEQLDVGDQSVVLEISPSGTRQVATGHINYIEMHELLLSEEEYLEIARTFIEDSYWFNDDLAEPDIYRKMVQKATMDGEVLEDIDTFQAGIFIDYARTVDVDGRQYKILDISANTQVRLNNDGSIINASESLALITSLNGSMDIEVRAYDDVYNEALTKVESDFEYRMKDWELGYKIMSDTYDNVYLVPAYKFSFTPSLTDSEIIAPEREVVIPAWTGTPPFRTN